MPCPHLAGVFLRGPVANLILERELVLERTLGLPWDGKTLDKRNGEAEGSRGRIVMTVHSSAVMSGMDL